MPAVAMVEGRAGPRRGFSTLAAALTVANVVRLALLARRDEIDIMQLVGAPPVYIRGPFVMEGVLQGGIGAIAALGLLWGAFVLARARYGVLMAGVLDPAALAFLSFPLCAGLLAGGMALGCAGGFVAARGTVEREHSVVDSTRG